eukprot:TRINITY_DN289_c3_g1_i1.p1 TRINITY_DN289_c3_g1~~TRINITY_DN289_c3_g1_i1.p1  ORF type:complete len:560 (+),score=104.15 TRINITY_DN289_c3_g1_i1:43-1722(+)
MGAEADVQPQEQPVPSAPPMEDPEEEMQRQQQQQQQQPQQALPAPATCMAADVPSSYPASTVGGGYPTSHVQQSHPPGGYSAPSQIVSLDNEYVQRSSNPVATPLSAGSNPYVNGSGGGGGGYPIGVNSPYPPAGVVSQPVNPYPQAASHPQAGVNPYPQPGVPTQMAGNHYPQVGGANPYPPAGIPAQASNPYPQAGYPTSMDAVGNDKPVTANPYPQPGVPTQVAGNPYPQAGHPTTVPNTSNPYPQAGVPTGGASPYPQAVPPTGTNPPYPQQAIPAPVSQPSVGGGGLKCRIVSNAATGSAINYSTGGRYKTALMIYQMKLKDVERIFGPHNQRWNREYSAAQSIFDPGMKGKAIRLGIRTQHKVLYSSPGSRVTNVEINRAADFFDIISDGLVNGQLVFFTYVITDDGNLNFCHTGSLFLQDFASKHAFHSSASETVRYAGEFHVHHDGLDPVLVVDNNSGTYAPAADQLPLVVELLRHNIPDLRVEGWTREDIRLLNAIENSPTRMSVQQQKQQQQRPQNPGPQEAPAGAPPGAPAPAHPYLQQQQQVTQPGV